MLKQAAGKIQTDIDVKRKAVKLVIVHLRKKLPEDFLGLDHVNEWLEGFDELLQKEDFNIREYHEKRRALNDVIESIPDEDIRFKLRDSWYSLGKALDKKVKIG